MDHRRGPDHRIDLHRRVRRARRRPPDQQGLRHAAALHLARHVNHLVKAGRDQARKADDIHLFLHRRVENLVSWHHHAKVDDIITVTGEHHTNDVLADIVHIAFHGRHQHLAVGLRGRSQPLLFLFHERLEPGDRLLHHARRFHHLRQEHLAGTEQVADDIHAVHQWPFNHV